MTFDELKEKAHALPLKPGVYIMQDAKNTVIYVGKAKALKNRVSQYFQDQSRHNEKTRAMVAQIDHFDVIIADSEFEALVLECSLIKRHQPHYNILLKDDKGYPYIRLSRDAAPDCHPADAKFELGKGMVVREGSDVTIIACGLMVSTAITAAEALAAKGISARVVDMYCIKPIDAELIEKCAKETGAVVTAEEHSVIGGLGGAVSEVLAKAGCAVPTGCGIFKEEPGGRLFNR